MNLGCCDCYDENSLKENFSIRSSTNRNRESSTDSSLLAKSSFHHSSTLNDSVHIRPIIHFMVTIYRRLAFTLTRTYYTILNYIFRNSLVDQWKSSCSDAKATSHDERAFYNYKITDVPEHLKFNPFILEGYRSNLSFKQSLLSFFYIHNESTNIYSHGEFYLELFRTI